MHGLQVGCGWRSGVLRDGLLYQFRHRLVKWYALAPLHVNGSSNSAILFHSLANVIEHVGFPGRPRQPVELVVSE